MNNILQVKIPFRSEKNPAGFGPINMRAGNSLSTEKIGFLQDDLRSIVRYYSERKTFVEKLIIDAKYNDIIAKSSRIKELIKPPKQNLNDAVVGARFSDSELGEEKHIITYYIDKSTIVKNINILDQVKSFIENELDGKATKDNFNELSIADDATRQKLKNNIYEKYGLKKNKMRQLIVDCSVIDSFSVPGISSNNNDNNTFLVTFYKTEMSLSTLFEKLKIDSIKYSYSFCGESSISMTKELFDLLSEQVPYMISMISSDLSQITFDEIKNTMFDEPITIPDPENEPIIGVIDTLFDENVYFHSWVENIDYLDEFEKLSLKNENRDHGTEVTSIIVDGPRLNPWLDDGCGRFRVRHFGVCDYRISTAKLVRKIKKIINDNPDIHVWNLSLGTEEEVSKNFISFDAAELDEIQATKNVIFVVSGTNDNRHEKSGIIRMGSPGDSLNSVVVNSIRRDGKPASYSRKGNVLSFFNKPDVSYYGGDFDERINVYSSSGEKQVYGTSFAAPWVSRKLCFLIDVLGMPKEIAKALIIDAAAGWEYKINTYKDKELLGYGVIPIDIKKIIETPEDEIKFVVYGTSEAYKTANYQIPVPKDVDDKYPFVARATMCYFPKCSRSQGIDYTNRELSLSFGRVNNKDRIEDINDNFQDDEHSYIDERTSRSDFRKWENTKFISKKYKNNRALKSYKDRVWGLTVVSKERLANERDNLNFGVVITLRELNGINRIDDFIKACTLRGWIVNEVFVENRIEVYNSIQEELQFDDI